MAASLQAPVNERLYFCRLQLDSYRQLLALAEAPKAVVERAMGEAMVFHLYRLYRCYLSELAQCYQGPAGDYANAAELSRLMLGQGVQAFEISELVLLEQPGGWLAALIESATAPVAAVLASRAAGPVQAAGNTAIIAVQQLDNSQSYLSCAALSQVFERMQQLIDSQRSRVEEW